MATVIVAGATPRAHSARSKFYVGIALFITAIVFTGFSRSFYGTVAAGVAHPWIIHVHAAVYVGWLALLITQSVLAARGQIALHRRVGAFGIGYGVLVWILGLVVSVAVPLIHVRAGDWPTARAEQFLIVPLGDMVLFGGFFGAAIAYRRRPEIHKRLILLAAVAVMFAAVGRVWFVDSIPVRLAVWYSPVLVAMAYDAFTRRSVHPVYWLGAAAMGVAFLRIPLGRTEWWHGVARAVFAHFA
jgi:hypothetical protein